MTFLQAVEPVWLRILNRQDEMLRRCATVETRFNKAGVEAVEAVGEGLETRNMIRRRSGSVVVQSQHSFAYLPIKVRLLAVEKGGKDTRCRS